MQILMVTASPPYPPFSGGAIRGYGILHGLYNAGHRVTLLTFAESIPADTPLAQFCDQIVTVPAPERSTSQRLRDLITTSQADIARRLRSDEMVRVLLDMLDSHNFGMVQFEGIEVANYLFDVRQHAPDVVTIYDAFNAEADLQRVIAQIDRGDLRRLPGAVYSTIQTGRVDQFERELCRAAHATIAVSDEDAALLRPFREDSKIHVVPSGVFVSDYTNSPGELSLAPNSLVFTGKMDYRPNVDAMLWFAEHVLPHITTRTNVHLYIVGQKPHPRLDTLRDNSHIHITGWVEAVQPYLAAADVYVAPLRMGSGTRLKILEAMASQCAMVVTSTAAAGLTREAHENMRVADDPAQIAAA
ncbi:MAG: glycosyltransferase, partial [Chloroflexota bacterium]